MKGSPGSRAGVEWKPEGRWPAGGGYSPGTQMRWEMGRPGGTQRGARPRV